jgi:hypothetical protein
MELRKKLDKAPNDPAAAGAALEIIDNSGAALYLLAELERHRNLGSEVLEKAAVGSLARDSLLNILQYI